MRTAVVIPAYNEETRIRRVLEVVAQAPEISEIWVVSDGSTDRTYEVAAAFPGARAVRLPVNKGKGAAMTTGAMMAHAPAVLFLDADLEGLTTSHIASLVHPVVAGNAEMTVGVFRGGRFLTDLAQKIVPCISGQRCMLRSSVLEAAHVAALRYGVEVALYRHALESGLRIETVTLEGVTHPMKEEKIGVWRGAVARARMYAEIATSLTVPTLEARRARFTRQLRNRLGI